MTSIGAKYEYNLFDLDGTLSDPSLGITNSIIYALEKSERPVPPRKELYKFIGPPLVHSFKTFCGMDEGDAKRALGYYREYFSDKGIFENELFDGIAELLFGIKRGGGRVILATGKPEEYASVILEHFGIADAFDFVAGNTLDEKRPEKTQVLAHIKSRYPALSNGGGVMVGDRCYDIAAAREFSLRPVGVTFGFGSEEELISSGAAELAKSVSELSRLLLTE